jgi:hypothetical protein
MQNGTKTEKKEETSKINKEGRKKDILINFYAQL